MMRKRGKGRSDRGTGVYAVGGEVYVTEIEDGDEGCRIRWAIRKTYLNPVDPAPVLMQLAESVRSVCQTYGLTQYTVGVTYAKEECFWYVKSFPVLPAKELSAAVQWDLALNCPYPDGRFWAGYCPEPDGTVKIAAVDEEHGPEMAARFEALDMKLSALILLPEEIPFTLGKDKVVLRGEGFLLLPSAAESLWNEGQIASLYAALSALRLMPDAVHFLPEHRRTSHWDWQKIGKGVLSFWLAAVLFLYLLNGWRIQRIEERLAEVNLIWETKGAEWAQMEKWQALQEENAQRDSVLARLSRERTSWSYIFYTLGVLNVPDVYLTSMEMKEDQALYCQGVAISYESLVEFLDLLEGNRVFFRENPRLEHFEKGEPQGITFSLRLKF